MRQHLGHAKSKWYILKKMQAVLTLIAVVYAITSGLTSAVRIAFKICIVNRAQLELEEKLYNIDMCMK